MLHEDKQYYPEAEQVYGKDVEALVEEEDHPGSGLVVLEHQGEDQEQPGGFVEL